MLTRSRIQYFLLLLLFVHPIYLSTIKILHHEFFFFGFCPSGAFLPLQLDLTWSLASSSVLPSHAISSGSASSRWFTSTANLNLTHLDPNPAGFSSHVLALAQGGGSVPLQLLSTHSGSQGPDQSLTWLETRYAAAAIRQRRRRQHTQRVETRGGGMVHRRRHVQTSSLESFDPVAKSDSCGFLDVLAKCSRPSMQMDGWLKPSWLAGRRRHLGNHLKCYRIWPWLISVPFFPQRSQKSLSEIWCQAWHS